MLNAAALLPTWMLALVALRVHGNLLGHGKIHLKDPGGKTRRGADAGDRNHRWRGVDERGENLDGRR